ncbi:hypothetical protein FOMPIDRAFT_1119579, partial [Fomitopsis schrenkii]
MLRPASGSLHLPHEVLEHIIGFLWDDPSELARCCLVCRAFLFPALYHLKDYECCGRTTLGIQNRAALSGYARWFRLNRNKPFGEQNTYIDIVLAIVVIDDSRRPFAHLFPMILPGCNIPPTVSSLQFHCIDWSLTRPHSRFFDCLAFFTGITKLELTACCLRSAWDLRRTVAALPNLESLMLNNI